MKGYIHSATVLADGHLAGTGMGIMAEKHGYLTIEANRRPPRDGLQRAANDVKESLEFLNDSFILKLENGETKINDF